MSTSSKTGRAFASDSAEAKGPGQQSVLSGSVEELAEGGGLTELERRPKEVHTHSYFASGNLKQGDGNSGVYVHRHPSHGKPRKFPQATGQVEATHLSTVNNVLSEEQSATWDCLQCAASVSSPTARLSGRRSQAHTPQTGPHPAFLPLSTSDTPARCGPQLGGSHHPAGCSLKPWGLSG